MNRFNKQFESKAVKIVMSIVPLIVTIFVQLMVSMILMFIYIFMQFFKPEDENIFNHAIVTSENILNSIPPDVFLIITAVASLSCIPIFGFWYRSQIKNKGKQNIKNILTIKNIFFILLLGFGLQFGIDIILNFIAGLQPKWFDNYNDIMKNLLGGSTLLSVITIGIIAPISEELTFRGVSLSYSKKAIPFMYANILQAVLFGICHLNVIQGCYAFVMGLFMGYVCMKFQSILAPILLHMTINLSGNLVEFILTDNINVPVLIIIFITSLFAIIISTVFFKNVKINSVVNDEIDLENIVEIK